MFTSVKITALVFLFLSVGNAHAGWNPILKIQAPYASGWLNAHSTMRTDALKIEKRGPGCQDTLINFGPVYVASNGVSYYFDMQDAKPGQTNPRLLFLSPVAQ